MDVFKISLKNIHFLFGRFFAHSEYLYTPSEAKKTTSVSLWNNLLSYLPDFSFAKIFVLWHLTNEITLPSKRINVTLFIFIGISIIFI